MEWIAIAAIMLFIVPLVHHLGFIEKAYKVIGKIADCAMCCTFWVTWPILMYKGCNLLIALLLSFIIAYLANYINLLLVLLDKLYELLWKKVNKNNQ